MFIVAEAHHPAGFTDVCVLALRAGHLVDDARCVAATFEARAACVAGAACTRAGRRLKRGPDEVALDGGLVVPCGSDGEAAAPQDAVDLAGEFVIYEGKADALAGALLRLGPDVLEGLDAAVDELGRVAVVFEEVHDLVQAPFSSLGVAGQPDGTLELAGQDGLLHLLRLG